MDQTQPFLVCISLNKYFEFFSPGNLRNSFWQYTATDELKTAVGNLLLIICSDLFSLIFCGIFLYFCCKINLFHVYLHLMKHFGLLFSIHQAYLLGYIFCFITIACAFDFTFKFDWVLDPPAWQKVLSAEQEWQNKTPIQSMF